MRKLLLLFVLLAIPQPAHAGYEAVFQKARAAAWAVYTRAPGGLNAICSATAYRSDANKTYLVTAGHCFTGSARNTDFLVTQDHFTFYAAHLDTWGLKRNIGASAVSDDLNDYTGQDYALISAQVGNKPVLPIGDSSKLVLGEDLLMVGVPLGVDFLAVQGIVGSTNISLSTTEWDHYFGANIFSAPGNSGSGVIDTKQQAIVGILVAGPGDQTSMAVFTPINLVKFK